MEIDKRENMEKTERPFAQCNIISQFLQVTNDKLQVLINSRSRILQVNFTGLLQNKLKINNINDFTSYNSYKTV